MNSSTVGAVTAGSSTEARGPWCKPVTASCVTVAVAPVVSLWRQTWVTCAPNTRLVLALASSTTVSPACAVRSAPAAAAGFSRSSNPDALPLYLKEPPDSTGLLAKKPSGRSERLFLLVFDKNES